MRPFNFLFITFSNFVHIENSEKYKSNYILAKQVSNHINETKMFFLKNTIKKSSNSVDGIMMLLQEAENEKSSNNINSINIFF